LSFDHGALCSDARLKGISQSAAANTEDFQGIPATADGASNISTNRVKSRLSWTVRPFESEFSGLPGAGPRIGNWNGAFALPQALMFQADPLTRHNSAAVLAARRDILQVLAAEGKLDFGRARRSIQRSMGDGDVPSRRRADSKHASDSRVADGHDGSLPDQLRLRGISRLPTRWTTAGAVYSRWGTR
jgi:hypothetical protein